MNNKKASIKIMYNRAQTVRVSEQSAKLFNENLTYQNTGGVSQKNKKYNFIPAFMDFESGTIYISSFSTGEPAPIHLYDGLPEHLVVKRNAVNHPMIIKKTVVSGFFYQNAFYTREQALELVELLDCHNPDK